MANILINMLGAGPPPLVDQKDKAKGYRYREANYYLSPNQQIFIKTPFVGEAIIKLLRQQSKTFGKLYIVGTSGSMWQTLFAHAVNTLLDNNNLSDEELDTYTALIDAIGEEVKSEDKIVSKGYLKETEAILSKIWDIEIACVLIKTGSNNDEFWDIFETLTAIPKAGDTVSFDMTNGLRSQPFFIVLALAYLRAVKKINIQHVYYGAYELKKPNETGQVLTSIFDMQPMLQMLDWVAAFSAFDRYGDYSMLKELLNDNEELSIQFFQKTEQLITALRLNQTSNLKQYAHSFITQLDKTLQIDEPELRPLRLIGPALKRFPNEILAAKSDWQLLMEIAEQHVSTLQIGLAVMVSWEAVIMRFANLFGVEAENHTDGLQNYTRLSAIARASGALQRQPKQFLKEQIYTRTLQGFDQKIQKLSNCRNALAHIRDNNKIKIADIPALFMGKKGLFSYLQTYLHYSQLEEVASKKFTDYSLRRR